MTSIAFTDDAIVLVRWRHVMSEVTIHDRCRGELRLGAPSSRARHRPRGGPPDGGNGVWVGYTDFFTPYQIWHHDVATSTPGAVGPPARAESAADLTSIQVFYNSPDGTRVPMSIIHRRDVVPTAPTPPSCTATAGCARWPTLAAGTSTEESHAPAWVPTSRTCSTTSSRRPTGWSPSAGQHATGSPSLAAATAGYSSVPRSPSPDLCRAVLTDRAGARRRPPAALSGRRNERQGVRRRRHRRRVRVAPCLLALSPRRPGVSYPAVLQGEADARVDPMHARKMCAALQAATTSGLPILLRRERNVEQDGPWRAP